MATRTVGQWEVMMVMMRQKAPGSLEAQIFLQLTSSISVGSDRGSWAAVRSNRWNPARRGRTGLGKLPGTGWFQWASDGSLVG